MSPRGFNRFGVLLGTASVIGIVGASGGFSLRKRSSNDAALERGSDAQSAEARCKPAKVLPRVKARDYRLDLLIKSSDEGPTRSVKSLSLDELKRYPRHSVSSSIPCQNEPRARPGDTSTASTLSRTWTGAQLRDLVRDLVREFPNDMKRIEGNGQVSFECLDSTTTSSGISFDRAVDPEFEVLLAYEANGEEITPSHGYPVRLVMPQLPGRNNVKWLSKIVFSSSQQQQSES